MHNFIIIIISRVAVPFSLQWYEFKKKDYI